MNYKIINQIGKGAFSNVFLCEYKDNTNYILFNIFDKKESELFIIKQINLDKLVNKYMKKSKFNILKNTNNNITQSLNITPYSNKDILKMLNTEEEYYYKKLKNLIDSEIDILKKISHNNIIKFYKSSLDIIDHDQIYNIEMEYCNYGDLYSILKNKSNDKILNHFKCRNIYNGFDIDFIKNFLNDVLSGLKYIHDLNIIHRDIKLQNILIKSDNNKFVFKISDFGFSCLDLSSDKLDNSLYSSDFEYSFSKIQEKYYKLCGTPYYMAPEIILNFHKFDQINLDNNSPKNIIYDKKIDIWSLGISLYELIFNKLPFSNINDIFELKSLFVNTDFQTNLHNNISSKKIINSNMKFILKKLLTTDHNLRISINELHELILYNNIDIIINNNNLNTSSNSFTPNNNLIQNVIYEPVHLSKTDINNLSTEWCKIDKNNNTFLKISIDNSFRKWLHKDN